jgi:hypothetical protein
MTIEKLITIVIIIIIAYYIDYNIKTKFKENENSLKLATTALKKDISDVKEVSVNDFYIKESQKSLKYLKKNKAFMDIIYNIRFVKKFDKSKYTNIIVYMDHLMKVYIYILADRYDFNTYLPVFVDLQVHTEEIFYSLYFVIPEQFKHIYGFRPHDQIDKSLKDFTMNCNKMKSVLTNYGKVEKGEIFINIEKYKPYEKNKEYTLP